jgi:transcriptional antiterminator RfaH
LSTKKWFVVHTKPRKEKVAIDNLQRQGFMAYCPQTIQQKRRRQCWQKVVEPLFPRYLFVQLNIGADNFLPIQSTLGVVGLVRFGDQPAVIPESTIEAIQQREQAITETCTEHPSWSKGDLLELIEGPFTGLQGIFLKKEGLERVSILLDILGRQNRFNVSINSLTLV